MFTRITFVTNSNIIFVAACCIRDLTVLHEINQAVSVLSCPGLFLLFLFVKGALTI